MRKGIIQKLTMLAFVAMVGIPAFAQGGKFGTNAGVATTIGEGHVAGDVFDLEELQYYVIDTESGRLNLEVIGFASYISGATGTGDPTLLESKYAGTVTIPHYLDPADVGVAAYVSSVAANAFTTTVLYPTRPGNSADSKDQFAAAAAKVTKLEIDYSSTELIADIGANAFAGLTDLEEVQCFSPTALNIPVSAFDEDTYIYASLKLPSGTGVAKSYSKATGWHEFLLRYIGTKLMGDSDANGKIKTSDVNDLKDLILDDEYDEMFDFDGNGKLQSADLNFLKNIVLSL